MAATESGFENEMTILLVPILTLLDSPHEPIRAKVMSLCVHINKRFKSSTEICLPVEKIVDLYIAPEGGNTVKSFALIYLEMGMARCPPELAKVLLPRMLSRISTKPQSQQMILIAIALPLFSLYTDVNVETMDPFNFKANRGDRDFILSKFLDVILYTVPSSGVQLTALNSAANAALPPLSPLNQIPTGLSKMSVIFITNKLKARWMMDRVAVRELKVSLLKFCMIDKIIAKDEGLDDKFILCTVALSDATHEVQFVGDGGLKRFAKPSYEDELFLKRLYAVYQGTGPLKKPNEDFFRSPATPTLKQRIIDALCRSVASCNYLPNCIEVVFDALFSSTTIPKLRTSGMMFVQWIARMAQAEKIQPVSEKLVQGLLTIIDEESTPSNEVQRAFAYETIGLLTKRTPNLFEPDMKVLVKFFEALSMENSTVCVSVRDALVAMCPAYEKIISDIDMLRDLKKIILHSTHKSEHHVRYVAVNFATRLFPFSDPFSKFICLISASDVKLEVKEQALKGLEFPSAEVICEKDAAIPDLKEMVLCIDRLSRHRREHPGKIPSIGNFTTETFTYIVLFIHAVILKTICPEIVIDKVTISPEKMQWLSGDIRAQFQVGLEELSRNADGLMALEGFMKWLIIGLDAPQAGAQLQTIASFYLLELVALGPQIFSENLYLKKDWILTFLKSPKLETKVSMARLLGIVCSANMADISRKDELQKLISSLMVSAESTDYDERIGSMLGLGFIYGRLKLRYNDAMEVITDAQTTLIIAIVSKSFLDSEKVECNTAACIAMAEIVRYGPMKETLTASDGLVRKMWEKMQLIIKSPKDVKLQEVAVATAGYFAIFNRNRTEIFDYFLTLPNSLSKQPEINFNIGESISACIFGFNSTHMDEFLDISSTDVKERVLLADQQTFANSCIDRVLSLVVPTQNSVTKKAVCIWLLCITKYCGQILVVQSYLLQFHDAFSSLLADKDDFTQEIASKGIGLIYEIGNAELKAKLVQNLVSTFTDGKKIASQSVTNDTQLFGGDIGATPDGGTLNTYQSILSLAADMNQPDLVYKFMGLASHHAIWNSKRGASMGFGSIAAQAEKELIPFLPKLVPRLYRYTFDPDQKTAQGMKNIWRSLVKDPVKSIDEFFEEIMKDVLKGMGEKNWRTREASCLALGDLLHGRQLEQLQMYMTHIWSLTFRILDDIKESVRKAAFTTAKALTNLTVRYANPTLANLERSQKVMDEMVPFFLEKGLNNTAEEVRQFSLVTILKLCKTGGILLKPHVSNIISTFLESLSSLEPQSMNYLALNSQNYNIDKDKLDGLRLSNAKSSPIIDALDQCVCVVDKDILKTLVPSLCLIIRKGIGLPTKAGVARFIYTLVQRMPNDLREHADQLLKALTSAIFDRSPVIRKAFSTALGHVCKLASPAAIDKITNHLKTTYLDSNDEDGRSVAPNTLLEMTRHAPNATADVHSIILPLAFMGARDTIYPSLALIWTEVWDSNVGSSSTAIRKWKNELFLSMSAVLKTSPSWALKKQVGKGMVDLAKALGSDIDSFVPSMLELLTESLAGRTWDGKESLLEGLMAVVVEGKTYFAKNTADKAKVEDIFLREAKKNNKPYRRVAIEYLGVAFDSLGSSRYEEYGTYLCEVAEDIEQSDDVDENLQKPMMLAIRANAYKAIGFAYGPEDKSHDAVATFLGKSLAAQVWNVRIAILEGLTQFLEKLKSSISLESIQIIIDGLVICLNDSKYRSVREHASKALKALVDNLGGMDKFTESQRKVIQGLSEGERDMAIQNTLKKLF